MNATALKKDNAEEPAGTARGASDRPASDGWAAVPAAAGTTRTTIFISKGTPEDDDFVLWLSPRLESQGYTVFADILSLEGGDRWRRELTATLQSRAVKMLLCCRDVTLAKTGVQEEIGIAEDVAKETKDPRFIIPLRLERFKKVFGIGELQFVDFTGGWAAGLADLLDTLQAQGVPRDAANAIINPNWENYRRRGAIKVEQAPEALHSNWLRIAEVPDTIRYYQPSGAIDHQALHRQVSALPFPAEMHLRGFFTFATPDEVAEALAEAGRFTVAVEAPFAEFTANGLETPNLGSRDAKNIVLSIFRRAWEAFCREKGLLEYAWSAQSGFHAAVGQIAIGKKLRWGPEGTNRSSMLRNIAQGKVWQFGVSATPALWPFPHLKAKSRVLFAELNAGQAGTVFDDKDYQHRCRRTVCKGWRNKQWHGRLQAFLALLADGQTALALKLSPSAALVVEATPHVMTSPVTTRLPDELADEDEETDDLTVRAAPAAGEEDDR
jgi:hypothetical protein